MDRTERFYRIDQLLNEYAVVPIDTFLMELGVSRATFKRDLEYLKDRLNAPIEWDRDTGGYRFIKAGPLSPKYELPGLWFNAAEIHALLSMRHLLQNLGPGLLSPHVDPLLTRLKLLLESADIPVDSVEKRIRILRANARSYEPEHFAPIATAVLQRKRLELGYYTRGRDETGDRLVSPQRLTHYRDNWYLDAWCHDKKGLRSFAVECIRTVEPLTKPAKAIAESTLNRELASSYGIFAGQPHATAVLRFTAKRARWVAEEIWHPEQQSRWLEDGRYELRLPYSDDRELLMDILKYGADVEVIEPSALREGIRQHLEKTASQYR